ncbi:DNA-binding IclR family transcriptional regulator [Pseudomonas sp. Tn43]|nr:DNA-binding IclR family transcriptional regulator [Pseudomonas sp. Tn43]
MASIDSVADTFTHCFAVPVKDPNGVAIATLCIVAPRVDAKNNYNDYRRVLINSAKAWPGVSTNNGGCLRPRE